MAQVPQTGSSGSNPTSPPPEDLYQPSDIRWVLREMGNLSAKVDRLLSDVEKLGDKLDVVRHQISFVRGALWLGGAILLALVSLLGWVAATHVTVNFH